MSKLSKLMIAASAAVASFAATAQAAFVPWTVPSDTIPGLFSYSGGGSTDGLFGDPIIAGSSFIFFPTNFIAQTSGANADNTNSRLTFFVDVAPSAIDVLSISVTELGDYSINNGGTVQASASLFVTNIEIPVDIINNPQTDFDTFARNLAVGNNEAGQWTLSVDKTLPSGWRRVRIDLDNILDASVPGAGSTAFIEKKIGGVTVTINVPEPASITAAVLGMGALLVRRRK